MICPKNCVYRKDYEKPTNNSHGKLFYYCYLSGNFDKRSIELMEKNVLKCPLETQRPSTNYLPHRILEYKEMVRNNLPIPDWFLELYNEALKNENKKVTINDKDKIGYQFTIFD